jgi:hypothetical protein
MMSGTIVFGDGRTWSASSGVFNWIVAYLADTVHDQPTRETLREIDEQNFRWLSLVDLSDDGRRLVLSALRDKIVPYSEQHLPHTDHRDEAVGRIGELATLARSIPD